MCSPEYIEPGSPRKNCYLESSHGKFRDEFLNLELLDILLEAWVLTARWRGKYYSFRSHSTLNYRPPALEAFKLLPVGPATLHPEVAEAAGK